MALNGAAIVYLCELVCQYPVNRLFQFVPVATAISIAVICWGTVVVSNTYLDWCALMGVRLLPHFVIPLVASWLYERFWVWSPLHYRRARTESSKGSFETFIQPGFTLLTSLWYLRGEQAQTIALWYCRSPLGPWNCVDNP